MKTTVIYHSADFDGLFCREIARKFLPEAELIGWDFGDEPIHWGRVADSETGHDALLGYRFDGKLWSVSLYHAKHRTDLNLSEIAKKHGGGGHCGACGFTASKLPFIP